MVGRLREAGIPPGEFLALGEGRAVPAVAAAGAGFGFRAVAGFRDEALPLAAGDRAAAEVVVPRQLDRSGGLVAATAGFGFRGAHGEFTGGDQDEVKGRPAPEVELERRLRGGGGRAEQGDEGEESGGFHRR
jgi:hypothetical protein